MDYFIKNFIFNKRLKLIKSKKKLYQINYTEHEINKYQITKFNKIWQKAYSEILFYKNWKTKYNLPNLISNIEELKSFPVLRKKHIQEDRKLIFSSLKNYNLISTGGSTGKPTIFPSSKNESLNSYANHYLARGWWGINPLDQILFFWGHSHLFGSGYKGKLNYFKRLFYDWLINTKRLNVYNMSLGNLESFYKIIKKSNPSMIIGYTSSIFKMAKYIDENKLDIGDKKNLKGVVVTSETVTDYDIKLIKRVFKVPCIIEYGMAETGVIAYSKENSLNIKIFWDSFIGLRDEQNILNITTINDRVFPLINYRTEDLIETNDNNSILQFQKILGRKNDFLKIKIGNNLIESHSEFFTHILKSIKNIENFKIIQKKNLDIEIEYVSINNFDVSEIFFNEISKEFNGVDKNTFIFRRVKDIQKTIAGKSKWIEVEK